MSPIKDPTARYVPNQSNTLQIPIDSGKKRENIVFNLNLSRQESHHEDYPHDIVLGEDSSVIGPSIIRSPNSMPNFEEESSESPNIKFSSVYLKDKAGR